MSLVAELQLTVQLCRRTLGRRRLRLRVSLLLLGVLVVFGTAGALPGTSGPGIQQPEPGVNKTYNETFRILASNDQDPYYNTTTIQVPKYEDNGSVTVVNKTMGTLPFRLRSGNSQGNLWPTQTLETAYMTDVYFTQFSNLDPIIPYRDEWTSLSDVREAGWARDIRFIRLNNVTYGEPTSTGGEFRVEVLYPQGFWLPVYRANVTATDQGYKVSNPQDALVLTPEGQMLVRRHIDGLEALLRYSALADSEQEAREKAAVPMSDGEELYPTASGGSAPLVWRDGSAAVVEDAYIGILDVPPGVWYRGRYVTKTFQVTGYVPWDYRVKTPGDYSESATCTIENTHTETHTHNNSTHTHTERETHTYSKTNWATYRHRTTDERINVTISNETYTQEMFRLAENAGIWSTYHAGDKNPLAPGNYTLRANLTITYTLQRHYGVDSEACPTWERTDTVTRTMTRTYSVPVKTVSAESPGLSINATVYDKPSNDVVVLNWTGDQRLTRNPWRQVTVSIGNETLTVDAPWHLYPVVQNTAVEERSDDGTTTYNASHSYGGRYPGLLRHRVGVANVTVRLSELAPQRSWWRETYTVVAREVPATPLPETIIAPDNTGSTPLYSQYAGVYLSNDEAMGEPVTVTADTIFGHSIENTSVDVVAYHNSSLDIQLEEDNGTTRVVMHLTAAETGAPLANRTLQLRGMNRSTVTTSANGTAYAIPTKTFVSATFSGDSWQTTRGTYYTGAHEGLVTGFGVLSTANTVFGYIDVAISNVVLLAEWLALGVFAYWWVRFQSPRSG